MSADHKSATVPVDLTEYRSGGNVASTFVWVVLNEGAGGWHLDHQQQQAFGQLDTSPGQSPDVPRYAGRGHGKAGGKGRGD